MNTRIYKVTKAHEDGGVISEHLVNAASSNQAIKHVACRGYSAEVPTPNDLVRLVSKGVKVEEAGE